MKFQNWKFLFHLTLKEDRDKFLGNWVFSEYWPIFFGLQLTHVLRFGWPLTILFFYYFENGCLQVHTPLASSDVGLNIVINVLNSILPCMSWSTSFHSYVSWSFSDPRLCLFPRTSSIFLNFLRFIFRGIVIYSLFFFLGRFWRCMQFRNRLELKEISAKRI